MGKIKINRRFIGGGEPVYIVAEMSANHNGDINRAVEIIHAAKRAGADAVKIQTYKAESLTLDCGSKIFMLKETGWHGRTLYDLYKEAATPWEWQPILKEKTEELGMDFFSSPFDHGAVDFLETMNVPAYKIASFEIVDIPLLKKVASTGKPVILSVGLSSLAEIEEAVLTLRGGGAPEVALLKCTSAYPAFPEDANLRTIPHLIDTFGCPAGISDHTLGDTVALGAVALGAAIVEKHLTLSRSDSGPDSAFSMEPAEFQGMVAKIRTMEMALGGISYGVTDGQKQSLVFRRSLFAVEDIDGGEMFTRENIRSIRPGCGLHTRYMESVLTKRARRAIKKGTPLAWDLIA